VRGVQSATIDTRNDEARVLRRRGSGSNDALVAAVRRAGYTASVIPVSDVTLAIRGMDCGGCPEKMRSALRRVRGVRRVRVLGTARAQVFYDRRRVTDSVIVQAIERAGFSATPAAH
jgi:Cu+-exporting ATPase